MSFELMKVMLHRLGEFYQCELKLFRMYTGTSCPSISFKFNLFKHLLTCTCTTKQLSDII